MSVRPPGPSPSILGGLHFGYRLYRYATAAVRERFETYGDLYVSGANPELFVTRHPDHFYEVLVEKARDYHKRDDLVEMLGRGLLTSNGETWRAHRRVVQPAFRKARLRMYANQMVEEADALATDWRANPERDVGRDMMTCTLRIVGRTLFGYDAREIAPIAQAMAVLQATAGFDPIPQWVPTPGHRRKGRALRDLDGLIREVVAAARRAPGEHLLGDLLEADVLDERALRDHLVTLFLAGHETTALALTWTWWLLGQHPEWADAVRAEVDEVVGTDRPGFEHVERLDVTKRVLLESLRLFPPAYALPRVAERSTSLGGYSVERGCEVILWTYWAHHDPRWFPNPERFDPDRFRPGSPGLRHPHGFVAFGLGPRTCIGRSFALMEGQLLLARWMSQVSMELASQAPPGLSAQITLGPRRPLRATVVPRGMS